MRTLLIVTTMQLSFAGILQAQPSYCTVTGYLFNPNGSPAAQADVKVINVVKSGPSFVLTPIVLMTDAMGFASFVAPTLSVVWINGASIGLTGSGDVAILIPDAASASLNALAQSAKPPVSGFSLNSGSSSTLGLSLSLEDLGINLNAAVFTPPRTSVQSFNGRIGAVTLTSSDISTALNYTPLDPSTVIGAVNASSASISDARLSSDVVRLNVVNMFSAQQTFLGGLQLSGGTESITASTNTDMMRFYRWNPNSVAGWDVGAKVNSQGAFLTNAWVTISGTGDLFAPPSSDSYMLGIWADVNAPAMQVRGYGGSNSYLFSGLSGPGNYTFSIEENGTLLWGASNTRQSLLADGTNLYRFAGATLKTDSTLLVGGNLGIGTTTPSGTLEVSGVGPTASYITGTGPSGQALVVFNTPNVINTHTWDMRSGGNGLLFRDETAGAYRLSIDNVGNVGIGTTNASQTLDVNGNINVSGSVTGIEIAADPVPPAAGGWNLYVKDDGTGKSELCVEFASGAPQCFARQP
jgi:hypothetical protein